MTKFDTYFSAKARFEMRPRQPLREAATSATVRSLKDGGCKQCCRARIRRRTDHVATRRLLTLMPRRGAVRRGGRCNAQRSGPVKLGTGTSGAFGIGSSASGCLSSWSPRCSQPPDARLSGARCRRPSGRRPSPTRRPSPRPPSRQRPHGWPRTAVAWHMRCDEDRGADGDERRHSQRRRHGPSKFLLGCGAGVWLEPGIHVD